MRDVKARVVSPSFHFPHSNQWQAQFEHLYLGEYAMFSQSNIDFVVEHLGGVDRLAEAGAHDLIVDDNHVTFRLGRPNPQHVRSVTITAEPDGLFSMDCYGPLEPGTLHASLIANAKEILPENLATVLGQLTGIERLHHSHY
jgi:hypothetical protein